MAYSFTEKKRIRKDFGKLALALRRHFPFAGQIAFVEQQHARQLPHPYHTQRGSSSETQKASD